MRTIRIAAMVALAQLAYARTHVTALEWKALPRDLTGRKVQVVSVDRTSVKGIVVRWNASAIELQIGKGTKSVSAANVSAISWKERKRARWSIAGAAIGGGPGLAATALVAKINENEGGSYGGRNLWMAVGAMGGGAVLGYFAGRGADVDSHEIRIVPSK